MHGIHHDCCHHHLFSSNTFAISKSLSTYQISLPDILNYHAVSLSDHGSRERPVRVWDGKKSAATTFDNPLLTVAFRPGCRRRHIHQHGDYSTPLEYTKASTRKCPSYPSPDLNILNQISTKLPNTPGLRGHQSTIRRGLSAFHYEHGHVCHRLWDDDDRASVMSIGRLSLHKGSLSPSLIYHSFSLEFLRINTILNCAAIDGLFSMMSIFSSL